MRADSNMGSSAVEIVHGQIIFLPPYNKLNDRRNRPVIVTELVSNSAGFSTDN
jgi:hypothetical protein